MLSCLGFIGSTSMASVMAVTKESYPCEADAHLAVRQNVEVWAGAA